MEFNFALEFHPTIRMLSNCIERLQINSCHYEIMPSARDWNSWEQYASSFVQPGR